MDKVISVKIRYENGSYSDPIPISVQAQQVEWDNTHHLKAVLGNIDINKGSVQAQINQLVDRKMNVTDFSDYVNNQLKPEIFTWLDENAGSITINIDNTLTRENYAADAKSVGDIILLTESEKSALIGLLNNSEV